MKLGPSILLVISAAAAAAYAGPLATCASAFQYSCVDTTPGGYTIITPLASTGSTEITGYDSSNNVIFDQTIPLLAGAPGSEVQNSVTQAEAEIALQTGQSASLPPCNETSITACLGSYGGASGSGVTLQSITDTYSAFDTPVTQTTDQYSTTIVTRLNGATIGSQTLSAAFTDPLVQAAILSADSLLTSDGATYGSPNQISSSSNLFGTQVSYVQTGESVNPQVSATIAFGPVYILITPLGNSVQGVGYIAPGVFAGVATINYWFTIDRNVITSNTYVTSQTYEIDGVTGSAVPEPGTWALTAVGVLGLVFIRARSARRKITPARYI